MRDSGQIIFSFSHIEGLTLRAVEEIYEVKRKTLKGEMIGNVKKKERVQHLPDSHL